MATPQASKWTTRRRRPSWRVTFPILGVLGAPRVDCRARTCVRASVGPRRPGVASSVWASTLPPSPCVLAVASSTSRVAPRRQKRRSCVTPTGTTGAASHPPRERCSDFASSVHDVLLLAARGGAPTARAASSTGVLGRQMERAATRCFVRTRIVAGSSGRSSAGSTLLHTGELTNDTLGPSARAKALREAVRELAVRGDEGRAREGSPTRSCSASAPRRREGRDVARGTSTRSPRGVSTS